PVPPKPDGLIADVDPTLGQEILDVAQRQRVSHVHHHNQADDLRRAVEISERVAHGLSLPRAEAQRAFGLTLPDRHVLWVEEHGRMNWQKASGYNMRSKVEAAISRYKRVIGDILKSRDDARRVTEVAIAVKSLNRMSDRGNANGVRWCLSKILELVFNSPTHRSAIEMRIFQVNVSPQLSFGRGP